MRDVRRIHLQIQGRVQGVFYRASARTVATRIGLSGWVCNRGNGAVEILVQGSSDQIEEFIAWCRQGPPAAHVERLEIALQVPVEEIAPGFEVRFQEQAAESEH